MAGLYPDAPGAAEQLLLCDGCFQAATGLLAECQDGCRRDLDHAACACATARTSASGAANQARLDEVPRAEVQQRLPTVGEEAEGMWHLHYADGTQARSPRPRTAWDYWHANGDGETPVPSAGKPEEAP